MPVIFGEMVDDTALLGVKIAAAEIFSTDFLACRGLHKRRAAEKDRALVAHDHALVAHRRDVSASGCAAAHHAGDLGNSLGAHLRLVEEDASEMIAIGEDFGLVGQIRSAAVHQVDAWQAVLLGNLLGPKMLL